MPSVARSARRSQSNLAPTHRSSSATPPPTTGLRVKERLGRLTVFLMGPFLACAYLAVVTVLRLTDRGHQ
ncbi:unnamed protein product [Gemmata massiliana]|uniref:Uncharacterized protein n=1 Tax=Gemmata massiliana TaxID=1210884 RepID=A0A6P2D3F4_9BACT|nr:unnamed protein product [Gemmata massiliana]